MFYGTRVYPVFACQLLESNSSAQTLLLQQPLQQRMMIIRLLIKSGETIFHVSQINMMRHFFTKLLLK